MLFQIKVQIMPITVLQDRTKGIGVYLEHIVQLHYPRMVQRLVNIVFSQRVPRGREQKAINTRGS